MVGSTVNAACGLVLDPTITFPSLGHVHNDDSWAPQRHHIQDAGQLEPRTARVVGSRPVLGEPGSRRRRIAEAASSSTGM